MNLKTSFAAILCSGALIIVGCAAHERHERAEAPEHSAGAVIDDSVITTKVKSALLAEDDVKSFDIKVTTYNGNVQLSGFVKSQWQIDKAVQVASNVEGVQHVTNDLMRQRSK